MTKKKKSPKQQPEIQMADNKDIMIITGTKMTHFFNVLDESPLKELLELRKSLKIPIWDYNDKLYLNINDIKLESYLVKLSLRKMFLISWI